MVITKSPVIHQFWWPAVENKTRRKIRRKIKPGCFATKDGEKVELLTFISLFPPHYPNTVIFGACQTPSILKTMWTIHNLLVALSILQTFPISSVNQKYLHYCTFVSFFLCPIKLHQLYQWTSVQFFAGILEIVIIGQFCSNILH